MLKKCTSMVVCSATIILALIVHAAADDLLLLFQTAGPDRYSDGQVVLDGEIYALVWSEDGDFAGVDVNGDPVKPSDKILLRAPIAASGRCPNVLFQLSRSQVPDGGCFGVVLLDTRLARKGRREESKVRECIPAWKLGTELVNASSRPINVSPPSQISMQVPSRRGSQTDSSQPMVASTLATCSLNSSAKISSIQVQDAQVLLQIEPAREDSFVRINYGSSSPPKSLDMTTPAVRSPSQMPVEIEVPKPSTAFGFFRAIRNPCPGSQLERSIVAKFLGF